MRPCWLQYIPSVSRYSARYHFCKCTVGKLQPGELRSGGECLGKNLTHMGSHVIAEGEG